MSVNFRTEKRVLINNASPLSKVCLSLWLVYDEMVKVRNGHQVRGVTPITPITVSVFLRNCMFFTYITGFNNPNFLQIFL